MSTRSLTVAQYEALKKSYASAEDMFIGHQNAEDYVFAPSPYSQYAFGAFETDSASTQKVFCILGQIRFVERYHSFNEQMKFPAGHPKAAKRALVIMPEFITNVEEWMSSLLDRSRQTKVAANWSNKGSKADISGPILTNGSFLGCMRMVDHHFIMKDEWNIEYSDESMNLTDEHKAEGIYEKWAEPRCADQGGKQKAEDKILYLPKPKVKILASGAEGQALSALEWDDLKRDEHVMIMFTPRFWASSKRGWDAHILAIRAYGTVTGESPRKRKAEAEIRLTTPKKGPLAMFEREFMSTSPAGAKAQMTAMEDGEVQDEDLLYDD